MASRRAVLRSGVGGVAAALAGCSAVRSAVEEAARGTPGCGDAARVVVVRPVATTAVVAESGDAVPDDDVRESLGTDVAVLATGAGTIVEARGRIEEPDLRQTLKDHGLTVETITPGASEPTAERVRDVAQRRVAESTETSGEDVSIATNDDGARVVTVRLAERDDDLERLLVTRGRIWFRLTVNGESTTLATGADVERVGPVQEDRTGTPGVPLTLTDEGATRFRERVVESDAEPESESTTIGVVLDGTELNEFRIAPNLYHAMESDDWEGSIQLSTVDLATARRVRLVFRSGAYPTPIETSGRSC